MRRRRVDERSAIPLRLQTFRAEEWPEGMTHNEWWDERRKWASERGVELPSRVGSDDADLAEEWSWHPERWATPDEWRAALFAWEDEHGRLRHLPSVPFEPAGRGTYDLSTGRWEPL